MKARNLIDLEDISLEDIDEIIHLAGMIKANPSIFTDACHGKIMATLFYEPSTRTQMSFKTAMLRLGGEVIGFDNPSNASVSKGESLKDTVRVVSNYADVLVMRNPIEGSAYAASLYSKSPVINAGDGGHLHPTQTLADLVTLSHEKGRLSDLTIGLCGDMKNGRTVHSLVKALSKYKNNKFVMISTPELQMPEYIIDILKKSGCEYSFSSSLEEAISSLDVLYMTRIQQERFKSEEEYERQKGVYVLDEEKMKLAKKDLVVLHPLPRVDEITVGVDDDSRAKYFEQTEYGMYARMALIILMLAFSQAFQDWTYDKLPNGYEIWRINSEDISLLKTDGDSSDLRIDRYILEFCYNDSYIGIKRLMIDENLPYQEAHIEDMDPSNFSYYLVDTVNDVVMGPYTAEEYENQIEALKIDTMCDWIKTVPMPEGAHH
jgi:aspartate carbamoyltransferase catalytic subunit